MNPYAPLIIAHRGASAHAPENTLAAFRMAIESGADGVEFDVRLAGDGVPVVIHDADLRRTGGREERILNLTSSQLGKIDVGSWFNRTYPRQAAAYFPRETVPTLHQVLELLKTDGGLVYIELKCGDAAYKPLAAAVCEVIRHSPLLPRIIVKSFTLAAIAEVRHLLPEVRTAALFEPSIMTILRRRKNIIAIAREFGAHEISLHRSLASGHLVCLAAEAKMPVTVWTSDNIKWLTICRERGIGALITNDPAKLLAMRS